MTDRDVMHYDVVIVGAGPAGLSCAIRLKQLEPGLSVCVLEKGAAVGAHMLSGCVMEPGPLDALLPEWRDSPPGICVPAKRDEFHYLTRRSAVRLPSPPQMHNRGNGKGGGIAAAGLDPAQMRVSPEVLRNHYLIQVAYIDGKARAEVERALALDPKSPEALALKAKLGGPP